MALEFGVLGGGVDLKKLSLEGFQEGHEDTCDVSRQSENFSGM